MDYSQIQKVIQNLVCNAVAKVIREREVITTRMVSYEKMSMILQNSRIYKQTI